MPRRPQSALLALDLFSDFRFPDGAALRDQLAAVAPAIGTLLRRARKRGVPVIYVNDHGGRWRDTFPDIVARAGRGRGRAIARLVAPTRRDYFVLKPRRSAYCSCCPSFFGSGNTSTPIPASRSVAARRR